MRIKCEVAEVEEDNEHGYPVESVCVTCPKCGHSETSFGTSDASITRSLCLLRENCPLDENNFYVTDD
jgi:hypothetical protein